MKYTCIFCGSNTLKSNPYEKNQSGEKYLPNFEYCEKCNAESGYDDAAAHKVLPESYADNIHFKYA